MRARLLLNPSSGNESGVKHLTAMVQALRERFEDVEIAVSTGAGHIARGAVTAIGDGCTHVFVAGGDGTVNEAIHGIDSVPGGFDRVLLGIVPLGTGNDLAGHLGIRGEPEACVRDLLAGRERRLDVGRLNDRHVFLNASAGGYVAESSERVSGTLKTLAGPLAYALGGTAALLDWEPATCTIEIDGRETLQLSLTMFAVGNARTVGGGNPIAPHAEVDDGLLDLCIVKTAPLPSFLATLGRLARSGHHEDEDVVMRVGRAFTLQFDRPIKVNVDGEVIEAERCAYRVDAGRARVLVPAS